jgi:glycerol 3-phosphatase-2
VSVLDRYEAFVVDLDGVCYLDGVLFEGVPEALYEIVAAGKTLLFVTNNSYRTPEEYAAFLSASPFEADPDSIVTSSMSAARLVREILDDQGNPVSGIVVAGGKGLVAAIEGVGIDAVAPEDWPNASMPAAIALGIDRGFDYYRLSRLASFVRDGAVFIATNTDSTYPTPDGLVPGAGAIVAAVEVASGKKATIAGKPHRPMVRLVSEILGNRDALVVGDRPDTDLAFAHELGLDSALVLSGVSGMDEALSAPYPPKFVAASLSELVSNPVEISKAPNREDDIPGGNADKAPNREAEIAGGEADKAPEAMRGDKSAT